MVEQGQEGAANGAHQEDPDLREDVGGGSEHDAHQVDANSEGGVENGTADSASPHGGESERSAHHEVHGPVLRGEARLGVGVHEDDEAEAEGASDLEEDRAEPVVAGVLEIVFGDHIVGPLEHEAGDEAASHLEEDEEEPSAEVEAALLGAQHEGQSDGRVHMGSRDAAGDQATEPHAHGHGHGARRSRDVREREQERAHHFKDDREQVGRERAHLPFLFIFIDILLTS